MFDSEEGQCGGKGCAWQLRWSQGIELNGEPGKRRGMMTDTCTFLIYRWNDEGGCQQAAAPSIVQRIHLTQLRPFDLPGPARPQCQVFQSLILSLEIRAIIFGKCHSSQIFSLSRWTFYEGVPNLAIFSRTQDRSNWRCNDVMNLRRRCHFFFLFFFFSLCIEGQ